MPIPTPASSSPSSATTTPTWPNSARARCTPPAPDFDSGLILTLYGKVLRWGPGWWLAQPSGLSEEPQAIAAQLRGVEAADPSQALKPPRAIDDENPAVDPGYSPVLIN